MDRQTAATSHPTRPPVKSRRNTVRHPWRTGFADARAKRRRERPTLRFDPSAVPIRHLAPAPYQVPIPWSPPASWWTARSWIVPRRGSWR